MNLIQKIKNTLNDSKDILIRNKKALGVAGAILTSPAMFSQGNTESYVSTPESIEKTKMLLDEEQKRLDSIAQTEKGRSTKEIAIATEKEVGEIYRGLQAQEQSTYSTQNLKERFNGLPEAQKSIMTFEWYVSGEDDKIQQVALDPQRFMDKSAGRFTLESNKIEYINDFPFVDINMVNFRDNPISATLMDYFRAANYGDNQIKESLEINKGWSGDDMDVIRNDDNTLITIEYTGDDREDIRTKISKIVDETGEQKLVDYPVWNPGETLKASLEGVLNISYQTDLVGEISGHFGLDHTISSDVQKLESYVELAKDTKIELEKRKSGRVSGEEIIASLENNLENSKAENKELRKSNYAMSQTADSLRTESTNLKDFLNSIEGGPVLSADLSGQIGYGLNVGRGVGKNNRTISLTGLYTPEKTTDIHFPEVVEREEKISENSGNLLVTEKRVSEWTTTSKQSATGLLGVEVINNLSLQAGTKYTKGLIVENTKTTSYQGVFLSDGEVWDEKSDTIRSSSSTTINKFEPVVGVKYQFLDGKLGVGLTYTFDKDGFDTKNIGMKLNYNIMTKD